MVTRSDGPFDAFTRGLTEPSAAHDPETHFALGVAYAEMGLCDDAILEFEAVLHAAPDHREARAAREVAVLRRDRAAVPGKPRPPGLA